MGLFSTLASATGSSSTNNKDGETTVQTKTTSSATIATVVQLYSNQEINLVEGPMPAAANSGGATQGGYSSFTYQAVQVGATTHDDTNNSNEWKNKHSNPDLGVWNCRVPNNVVAAKKENSDPQLVDSLLANLAKTSSSSSSDESPQGPVYAFAVDLSDATMVEPNLSALQATLVRHLIEHPPPNTASEGSKIQTTSLFDLQTIQFGLASSERIEPKAIDESAKNVRIGLMICAVVEDDSNPSATGGDDISSEMAFKKKQARALIDYHLRKFANAINAALCFVERRQPQQKSQQELSSSEGGDDQNISSSGSNLESTSNSNTQPSISYDKLAQLWRDMAMGVPVWEKENSEQAPTGETNDIATRPTALYGPGHQQEESIETLLLPNAHYPGHWNASTDSLWVALPAEGTNQTTEIVSSATGDDGWLTQLRDSIVSTLPSVKDDTGKDASASEAKPVAQASPKKDAAVSSFFESLLKNP